MAEFTKTLLYQTHDGATKIQLQLNNVEVWLMQADLMELFQFSKSNIKEHIYEDGLLIMKATVQEL
jgi:hypothetical protein